MLDLSLSWSSEVLRRFPGLAICLGLIRDVSVRKSNEAALKLREEICDEVKDRYRLETLKDHPTVRAYRDFYWKLGIDPTKTRPSGAALLRRVLHNRTLPTISTVVDAYNLASMKTNVPISGFDNACLNPPLTVRYARNGETFTGIGMSQPRALTDKLLVLADQKQVLCIYPYRDSNATKVAEKTKEVLVVGYGTPGISSQQLRDAVETTLSRIRLVAGGEIIKVEVLPRSIP